MDMKGTYRIEATRERVWAALNDPDVLKQCIPGCEEIEKTSPTEFSAKVTAKVGPVKARFAGDVTLTDLNPPESYTITGEGKGGAAGFAKGGAKVHLTPDGQATLLDYEVSASVGGKLAQLGGRLIDGTAKKMADDFFRRFSEQVTGQAGRIAGGESVEGESQAMSTDRDDEKTEPTAAPRAAMAQPAPFPPAQPDMDAAAAASVGGPGEGFRAAAERRADTAPEPAARAAGPATAGPTAAGPTAAAPRMRLSRRSTAPTTRGLSPVTWIAGLIVLVLLLIWLIV